MTCVFSRVTLSVRTLSLALLAFLVTASEGFSQFPPPPGGGGSNAAPRINSLFVSQVPGKKFRVTGTVSDENPAGCVVNFTGAGSGSVAVSATGSFDGIINVPSVGMVNATPNDGVQNGFPRMQFLFNAPPNLANFTATQGDGNVWTFTGNVMDEAPNGLTVTLSGGVSATGLVGPTGQFSISVSVTPGSSGQVTATVADWYNSTATATTYFGS